VAADGEAPARVEPVDGRQGEQARVCQRVFGKVLLDIEVFKWVFMLKGKTYTQCLCLTGAKFLPSPHLKKLPSDAGS
jgi:hypothetical protein